MNVLQKIYYELRYRNCVKVIIIPQVDSIKWFIIFIVNGVYYGISSGPVKSIEHYFKYKLLLGDSLEKQLYIREKELKLYFTKARKIIEKLAGNKRIVYKYFYEIFNSSYQYKPLIKK